MRRREKEGSDNDSPMSASSFYSERLTSKLHKTKEKNKKKGLLLKKNGDELSELLT
jgi:hypothetical protein